MRKALSVKAIEAFKPKVKRYEVHDLLCPGFSLRVFPTGRKVFTVKYRYGLTQRRLPIGVHPRISLADARNKAMEALRLVDEGFDPAARRRQLSMTVESVCADFIRQYARPRNRSWREAERILQREFVSAFGRRDIREIKRHDIIELMDAAIERGAAYQANRIHAQAGQHQEYWRRHQHHHRDARRSFRPASGLMQAGRNSGCGPTTPAF